jgi:hypothetical protein
VLNETLDADRRLDGRSVNRTAAIALLTLVTWLAALPAEAQQTSLTFRFTNFGEPLPDSQLVKFFVFETGKRENYVAWGHDAKTATFPEGTYDIVIRYENDQIVKKLERNEMLLTGWIEEDIDFDIPVAQLTLDITSRGIPIPTFSGSYSIHRRGKRGKPLARKRPGETLTIRPGVYDIEVVYRSAQGLESRWLEGYALRDEKYDRIDFDSPLATVRMTLRDGYQRVPQEMGEWKVFRHADHREPLAERRSGELLSIEAGVYDVGLFLRAGDRVSETWMTGVQLSGAVEREIDMSVPQTSLRLNLTYGGRPQSHAWFSVFEAGHREAPLVSARSGTTVVLEPGQYDIRCFLGSQGLRSERWLESQNLGDSLELQVELGATGGPADKSSTPPD